MMTEPTAARENFRGIAPALAEMSDKILFGDVWRRPGLSPRDRSLVTVAGLISTYRENELGHHRKLAMTNGIGRDELVEVITHLAIYACWPPAMTALDVVRKVFAEQAG